MHNVYDHDPNNVNPKYVSSEPIEITVYTGESERNGKFQFQFIIQNIFQSLKWNSTFCIPIFEMELQFFFNWTFSGIPARTSMWKWSNPI
jgi:hypothetical protein